MNATETLSTEVFNKQAEKAIKSQVLRKTVNISELDIQDTNRIQYKNKDIYLTQEAFKQLIKILKMPLQFVQQFDKLFDRESQINFIRNIKRKKENATDKSIRVTLYFNPQSEFCVSITKDVKPTISNENAISLVEEMLSNSGLEPTRFKTYDNTGAFTVSAINNAQPFNIQDFKDENHIAGINVTNSPITGFSVDPYVNRLICNNGMTMPESTDTIKFNNQQDSMSDFMNQFNALKKNDFIPTSFTDNATRAIETQASVEEIFTTYQDVTERLNIDQIQAQKWIPFHQLDSEFIKHTDHSVYELQQRQKQMLRGNMTVWNLIQAVTNMGRQLKDAQMITENANIELEQKGGKIFNKQFDLAGSIKSPF